MARSTAHPFDVLIEHAANILAERLPSFVARSAPAPTNGTRAPGDLTANEKRRRAMLGRKLDMSCRVVGCKNRSGGPGKGYMCPGHQKLPKRKQQAARDAWKAAHAA